MVRTLVVALLLVTAGAAGCLTGEYEGDDSDGGDERDADLYVPGDDQADTGDPSGSDGRTPAPSLSPGLAWTYETSGVYNTGQPLTIVVARETSGGYLFAGGAPSDLVEDVHWDRAWLGFQTFELNPRDDQRTLFDFPLADGKTWSWGDDGTVTATRTTVQTPGGPAEGFEMTVEGTSTQRTWTFAPSMGYLTSYEAVRDGTTYLSLALTEVTLAEEATWYEAGEPVVAGGDAAGQATLPVDNASAVSLSAGGWQGGQASVLPPIDSQQEPWTFQASDDERWTYDLRPAAPGDWQLSTTQPPTGYAYVSAASVTWEQIQLG